jgi:thiol-disulfide isomerase/thioredoxin
MQKLIGTLETLDKSIAAATSRTEQTRLNGERADLLERIVKLAESAEDRNLWIRQYAETISAAVQSGVFPEGPKRLETLYAQVSKLPDSADLAAYIKFRRMSAAYNLSLQDKDADFEKINAKWMEDLEAFVKDHDTAPDAAEAMLQLAIGNEFSGKEKEAIAWFGRISTEFPRSDLAPKAVGAKRRLESTGKRIDLKGKTIDGRAFDLATAKGKAVLVHYWATWCEPCKQDLETIRGLQAKYGKDGFVPVGVNLDNTPAEVTAYLRANKSLPWAQVYEPGGLDGRLATELGILTLPTMILIDRDGKVVNRNIHAGELDTELKKLLR